MKSTTLIGEQPGEIQQFLGPQWCDVSPWWLEYLEAARAQLRETPHMTALTMDAAGPYLIKADSCPRCRPRSRTDLARYMGHLGDLVDKAVAEVSIRA